MIFVSSTFFVSQGLNFIKQIRFSLIFIFLYEGQIKTIIQILNIWTCYYNSFAFKNSI